MAKYACIVEIRDNTPKYLGGNTVHTHVLGNATLELASGFLKLSGGCGRASQPACFLKSAKEMCKLPALRRNQGNVPPRLQNFVSRGVRRAKQIDRHLQW